MTWKPFFWFYVPGETAQAPLQVNKKQENDAKNEMDRHWYIAVTACLTTFVSAITLRNSGLLYVGFIDEFGTTRGEASWPTSIYVSSLHAAGEKNTYFIKSCVELNLKAV